MRTVALLFTAALAAVVGLGCQSQAQQARGGAAPTALPLEGLQVSGHIRSEARIKKGIYGEGVTLFAFHELPLTGRQHRIACRLTPPEGAKLPKKADVRVHVSDFGGTLRYEDTARVRLKKDGRCIVKTRTFAAGTIPAYNFVGIWVKPIRRALEKGTEVEVDFEIL